jgi:hypothetical protein
MKTQITILLILCGMLVSAAPTDAEVFHPQRVYPTSGTNKKSAGQKKKHWWQRKETPETRAKQRAKMLKKRQKANAKHSQSTYDAIRNSPLPN